MKKDARIYVAGHTGLLGSAVVRRLKAKGYKNIITATRAEVNIIDYQRMRSFFGARSIDYVFLCAARVGGIAENNKYPTEFLTQNIHIQSNVLYLSWAFGVKKLLFTGSSCMYPLDVRQPLEEANLFAGSELEPTNEAYAWAKLTGIKMCKYYNQEYGTRFISAIPCNLYGPNDNYSPEDSHFLPALLRRLKDLKVTDSHALELWGDGTPRRELMYSDDCADALIHLMNYYEDDSPVNIGTGKDHSITQIARLAAKTLGIERLKISYDKTRPNGVHSKRLDVSKMSALGWKPKTTLQQGIKKTYAHYVQTLGK